jgi:penicillin-binding protein 2
MRIKVISGVLSALFAVLILSLAYTQILKNKKYTDLSKNNRVRLIPQEGQRGRIFDTNGILLVSNRPCFDVVVIPQELQDSVKTLSRTADILGMAPKEVFKKVEKNYTAPFAPILIKEDVDKKKAMVVEEENLSLPGIMIRVTPKREYRFNEAGSHVLGYLGEIDRAELDRLKDYGYQIKDMIGKSGLEDYYDTYLRGEEGGMQLEVNNRGYFVKSLGAKEAAIGRDLTLTIDIRLQQFIENLLAGKNCACVAMAPSTGEVLALVSKPGFDPAVFISRENGGKRTALLNDANRPMLNRAISGLYPPGSVFKPVIAAAGLEKKRITAQSTFFCGGKYMLGSASFACWDEDGHGYQDVTMGLKNSCNVFFYQLGRAVGADDIYNFALKFGYGAPAGIDLHEEASGLVPNKMWKRLSRKEAWFEGDTLNFSIGQGYLLVTPLQVLRMIAAISNGGILVQPYIVKKIDKVEVSAGKSRDLGISKKTLDIIRAGLKRVVEDETGTGRRARVEGISVSGKTGTAQNPNGLSHAWFAGYAPTDKPKIAIVVFIEHGGKGGLEAAESAGKILTEAKRIGLL